MLYYLFDYLEKTFDFPGVGLFKYISFRAGMAAILSLFISIFVGKYIIKYLQKHQIGEEVRTLGLAGEKQKKGTPTMGGIIIILAILIPILLFAKITNIYIILMVITTLWLGLMGFIDDYIKTFKKDKAGLKPKFKLVGQIGLGIIIGGSLALHWGNDLTTTIPFIKGNEFDYSWLISWISPAAANYTWIVFILVVIFIITATSNAVNLTDGIDGLAAGTTAISGLGLMIFAWVSGNIIFSSYLNIMFLPNVGELTVFIAAFMGATVGFLWHNSHPATVFMGDTGSLTIGGIIAVFAILIRKEFLLPILCGIFFVETISVMMQTTYFKLTKKTASLPRNIQQVNPMKRFAYKFRHSGGEGKRLFLMTPLHHHYQKQGFAEEKIVMRFYLVSIILVLITLITLKLR